MEWTLLPITISVTLGHSADPKHLVQFWTQIRFHFSLCPD